jgi:hypothetical protein
MKPRSETFEIASFAGTVDTNIAIKAEITSEVHAFGMYT